MRWSIIRLIWLRELRDQLRDRRTIVMIAVLPVLLYPLVGFGLMQMAQTYMKKPSAVLVEGADNLPPFTGRNTGFSPLPVAAWLSGMPSAYGGVAQLEGTAFLAQAGLQDPGADYPPLFIAGAKGLHIAPLYFESALEGSHLSVRFDQVHLAPEDDSTRDLQGSEAAATFLKRIDRSPLDNHDTDLLVVFPPDFRRQLDEAGLPPVYILGRENDERSTLAKNRMLTVLGRWKNRLKETRLLREHLPPTFDEVFELRDPQQGKPLRELAANELFDLLAKVMPVILIMWSLAGALYPAIDLCAGEKERGTMETLLISPASREEIVYGKFLTIWVFSAMTALLNLVSMGITTGLLMPRDLPQDQFRASALFWGIVLLLPVSAFFSAICLAVGAYARSSKEGQYYLMPLFMVTMPLIFLTLAPDVVLNPFWSMVPVTGIALLLQSLISPGKLNANGAVWYYFVPVLAPMVFYSWLALRWAIEQFKREEVLFREAERLDIALWLRRLFREKERLPSAGEAVFCFVLILLLNRLTLSLGDHLPLLVQAGIRYLAFMAAPALFMALLLTTRPAQGLALRLPPRWAWPAAVVLGISLVLPCVESMRLMLDSMPTMKALVEEYRHSVTLGPETAPGAELTSTLYRWLAFLVFVAVGAVSEEIAFRGFILSGLRQRFRPTTAIFLSAFLFALSQMNVFQFVPHFLLGLVLAFLVIRSGSLWPAILFHLIYNTLVTGPGLLKDEFAYLGYADEAVTNNYLVREVLAMGGALLAGAVLVAIARFTQPPTDTEPLALAPESLNGMSGIGTIRAAEATAPTST